MANFQDIRRNVVEMTGRQDLILPLYDEAYYPDADLLNVDFYIHAGQKMLDQRVDFPGAKATLSVSMVANDYLVPIPLCRVIENIWVEDADDDVKALTEQHEHELLATYGAPPFSDITLGTPKYYALTAQRAHVATNSVSVIAQMSKHIYVVAPPSEAITLKVQGKYYSAPLTADEEVNWWTEFHDYTLTSAAIYMIERFYRNTQGMKDALASIDEDLRGIDADVAEQQGASIMRIANSW